MKKTISVLLILLFVVSLTSTVSAEVDPEYYAAGIACEYYSDGIHREFFTYERDRFIPTGPCYDNGHNDCSVGKVIITHEKTCKCGYVMSSWETLAESSIHYAWYTVIY